MEGHIWIDEQISNDTYESVKAQLQQNADKSKLVLHIASPGGSVYAGYKIYNALKLSRKPIHTIIEGEAQSMATFIAMAGDKISICNPSVYMIHNPHSGVEGTAKQMIEGANELIKIEDEMSAVYSKKTGIPVEKIKQMMASTTIMTADEAKKLGFADEIIGEQYLKAVAIGKPVKKMEKKNFIQRTLKLVAEALGEPTAMDVQTDKGTLMIQSEDGDFMGKPATLNGQPATGEFTLQDGRKIMVENGIVTSVMEPDSKATPVTPAPAPVTPPPAQSAADAQLAALQAEIAKIKAEKDAADAAKAKAEQEAEAAKAEREKTAQALGQIKKELEEEAQKPIGDQGAPKVSTGPTAAGIMKTQDEQLQIMATRTYIVENMPWLERHYKNGKFADGTDFNSYRRGGPNAVSILETNFNYTWNGVLTTDIFFKPSLSSPALADIFTVDLGSSDKKRYNLVNPISKVLQPYTGCGGTPANNRQLITNTTIQLKPFQMYESWCKDDFTGQLSGSYNYLAQEWLKTGNMSFDPANTPVNTIIVDSLKDALRRDVFRRVSFAASNSSDSDYNQIDGLWDRLIDSSGAANYCVFRAGSPLGTGTISGATANSTLEAMWGGSNLLLKEYGIDNGKAKFYVTRSFWDAYYGYLVGVGAVTEQAYANYVNGMSRLTYRGIDVIPVGIWDSFLAESDNPLFATTRHLALLTVKDNHILGVENNADLEKIDSWFENKDQKRYYRANMTFGYQYLHCDLQTIAY